MFKNLVYLFILFGLATPVFAQTQQTMTKIDWSNMMIQSGPVIFCKTDTPMRKCFNVTEQKCLETTKTSIQECLKQLDATFPKEFKSTQEATAHNKRLGECVGKAYAKKLDANIQKCDI